MDSPHDLRASHISLLADLFQFHWMDSCSTWATAQPAGGGSFNSIEWIRMLLWWWREGYRKLWSFNSIEWIPRLPGFRRGRLAVWALSIPLNGFLTGEFEARLREEVSLSIPLNGFPGNTSLWVILAISLSFNSIEWIRKGEYVLKGKREEGKSFNSIEWIHIIIIYYTIPPVDLAYFQFHWMDSSLSCASSRGSTAYITFNSIEWIRRG